MAQLAKHPCFNKSILFRYLYGCLATDLPSRYQEKMCSTLIFAFLGLFAGFPGMLAPSLVGDPWLIWKNWHSKPLHQNRPISMTIFFLHCIRETIALICPPLFSPFSSRSVERWEEEGVDVDEPWMDGWGRMGWRVSTTCAFTQKKNEENKGK